jgi:hypothetical protein
MAVRWDGPNGIYKNQVPKLPGTLTALGIPQGDKDFYLVAMGFIESEAQLRELADRFSDLAL